MKSQLYIHFLLLALMTFPTFICNESAEEDHHDEDEGDYEEDYEDMDGDDEYPDDEGYEDYPEDYHIEL